MRKLSSRRFPWLSASLLFVAYAIFSKLIISTAHLWTTLVTAAGLGVILALIMMHPLTSSQKLLAKFFRSDSVAFAWLVCIAAFSSILLNWLKIFMPIIMVLSAESLVRIDLQTAEYTQTQALAVLVVIAWLGLGLGWLLAILI
ncbi:MAG TPA: hypothetical protein VL134_06660 [Leptolyngbya sp.]|nr:hypothetical protein [Leptolyngbya sp.]